MPIRQGKAKLWFKTKEETEEFDDKMISNIIIQSENPDDDNYTTVFFRKRKQYFLELSDKAKSEIKKFQVSNISDHIDKYHSGKRDHTFWRQWTVEKFGLGYAVSYLVLRELPIRNFYARAWIMFYFISKVWETNVKGFYIHQDEWTDKDIKNYAAFKIWKNRRAPSLNGQLPEQHLWKLNQPGFMRNTPVLFPDTAAGALFSRPKVVAWDGTFNMPLQGLAHPKHKDAKFVDFIYE